MTTMTATAGAKIPGPSAMPVLGWTPFLLRFGTHPLDTLEDLRKKIRELDPAEHQSVPGDHCV